MFHQLTRREVRSIVDLMLKRVREQLKAKALDIELTDEAKTWLALKGYDAELGARPLRRTIQREVEDALSERMLLGEYKAGQLIVADVEDDELMFRAVDAPPDSPPVELAGAGAEE